MHRRRSASSLLLAVAVGVLTLMLVIIFAAAPAFGQMGRLLPGLINTGQIGDLVYGSVRLDGSKLFEVAVKVSLDEGQARFPPAQLDVRIARIENRLEKTLQQLMVSRWQSADQIIVVNKLNAQMVVQASFNSTSPPLSIVTVTSSDAEIYGLPAPDLASYYAERIQLGLLRSYQQRQPRYIQRQLQRLALIGGIAVLMSAVGVGVVRYIRRRQQSLQAQINHLQQVVRGLDPQAGAEESSQLSELRQSQHQLQRRLNNAQVRSQILHIAILFLWLLAISLSLRLFPQTRNIGVLLVRQPIWLMLLWFGVTLAIQLSHLLTDRLLDVWAYRRASASLAEQQRRQQRLPPLSRTLKDLESGLLVIVGVVLAFRILTFFSNVQLVASAGVIGLAASIGLQSLFQDAVRGAMVLWQDAFTVGDIIEIGSASGYVESLNLVVTQLRGSGGELVTLNNGEIATVKNMTKDWSRMDLTVEVAYEADVDQALYTMGQTLEAMAQAAEWQDKILEAPDVLAVEHLAASGVTLKIRVKTAPMQQWTVSRDYRRRLKQAFDQAGIVMGRPQQTIALDKLGSDNRL